MTTRTKAEWLELGRDRKVHLIATALVRKGVDPAVLADWTDADWDEIARVATGLARDGKAVGCPSETSRRRIIQRVAGHRGPPHDPPPEAA